MKKIKVISFKFAKECELLYSSSQSSGADLKSRIDVDIKCGNILKIPTGVWIDKVYWDDVPRGTIPDIQIRSKSGLSLKYIALANGVGTIDIDYPDEIQVPLFNFGVLDYKISKGDKIAQVVISSCFRIKNALLSSKKRLGGFGSTGR
jgi:dUTP pyrophosphatase